MQKFISKQINMTKILFVFGTRPEFIKMAPVIQRINKKYPQINAVVCNAAQHRQMVDNLLKIFNIKPDYDMDIMKNNQDLFDITINVLNGIKNILKKEKPDLVLVQGDTSTAFVSALASFYLKIPIGHIEAGLRTYNKYSPFPEEINRHLLDVFSDYYFAPTEYSKLNLIRENIPENKIWVTGNTVIDALLDITAQQNSPARQKSLKTYFKDTWNIKIPCNRKLILITGHRRENFGEGFKNICEALKEIAHLNQDIDIVYPVHFNPNVRKPVNAILNGISNIYIIEPLDYEKFVFLMNNSYIILTDSGGIQEEAPSLGKPVLVMRNTTERPEGVKTGTVKLVGTTKKSIINNVMELLYNPAEYKKMANAVNPYGDGKASEKIINIIKQNFI